MSRFLSIKPTVYTAIALAIALQGCATLPSSGPTSSELIKTSTSADNPTSDIIVVDLNEKTTDLLASRGHASLHSSFGDRRTSSDLKISIGDTVSVTLWEAGAGGLFTQSPAPGAPNSGSKATAIPEQVVSRDGAITVPYAGRVKVSGLTPRAVEDRIVKQLEGKALQPQALVTINKNIGASASVLIAEGGGARVPLSLKGDRLVEVLAQAGGLKAPVHETFVTISRQNRTARVPLQSIVNKPSENIFVQPNDVITLTREPQTFTVVGAAAKNAQVPFDAIGITLEEAIGKSGGLIDSRSDAEGVFIMRFESVAMMKKIVTDQDLSRFEGVVPVAYRLNLREARGFFTARRFPMLNKDILYISNAPLSEVQKALTYFNLLVTPVYNTQKLSSGL